MTTDRLRNIPQGPLRLGKDPDTDPHYPGHGYRRTEFDDGIVFERDVAVELRDGTTIYVDVFRPADSGNYPVLLGWAPFGKHPHVDWDRDFPGADIPPGNSAEAAFEAVDPHVWVPWGYVVVNADPRGIRYSEGIAEFMTLQEGEDEYDLIEWLAVQPWSSGRVATTGVSYFAMSAYRAAELRPPHLTAVVLWEALTDFYRDVKLHGGIPSLTMSHGWMQMTSWSNTAVEDLEAAIREHPLYDDYWQRRVADLTRIEVPMLLVSSWANHGVHTRGTFEAWERISSKQKWLDANGRKEWEYFYSPESVARQRAFLDHFLHDRQTELAEWAPVRLEVRESLHRSSVRWEQEYPLARTEFRPYHLDADSGRLSPQPPSDVATVTYPADTGHALFDLPFDTDTEIVGPAALRLWIEAVGSDDADLFVGLRKFDAEGHEVNFKYIGFSNEGIVALGWLRVSHRELDPERSTPARPYPRHASEQRLYQRGPVYVEVPILDSGTLFEKGSRLQLEIAGHDIVQGAGMFPRHSETRNKGLHVIHTGPQRQSSLLLPIVREGS
ncbi:CocE/NonD family hydrolase [Herbiconiux ginsengi]|uniref:Xaa-Pro dipeptidyl-peptidase C-terminal domain-containing protein n=1 Tax=Herbiconiux ginsengi TaxID=381665 RepID=A0A1H3TV50_9MICO|nr:CocE/NonD family hydrolase [Herbiconiux ginsengi]SDZ54076.1 hypothetical protein SAMN05216554_4514 [Herbiconiux ginsengi]